MARPKGSVKPIDLKQVEALASIGCTQDEIGVIMGVVSRTLRRRKDVRQAIENGHSKMRSSLRRWQYEKAKDGNVAMLIWLGKQIPGSATSSTRRSARRRSSSSRFRRAGRMLEDSASAHRVRPA